MSKKLVKIVMMLVLLLFAGSIMALQAEQLSDVPQGHWAYDAVIQLARKGLIEGYPEGVFKGERNATRYEMALVVARLLAKIEHGEAKLDAQDKETRELIDKLIKEFHEELDALGVKVAKVEDIIAKHETRIKKLEDISYYIENHSVYASNNMIGNSGIPNATTYDMSFFEWNLGRGVTRNASTNLSSITQNASYPMANSTALTSNTKLGFKSKLNEKTSVGADFEIYTASDSDNVPPAVSARRWRTAQVFGATQPGGLGYNALLPEAVAGNRIQPGSAVQLFNIWASQKGENYQWKGSFGSFWPFSESKNEVKLDHFFFRSPVSNMSIFGHQIKTDKEFIDFKSLPGREPVRGVKIDGKFGQFDYNLFTGQFDETPRLTNTYYRMTGGRLGYTYKKFGIGVNVAGAELTNPRTAAPTRNYQRENNYGADASYAFTDTFKAYGAYATSRYTENGPRINLNYAGNAAVVGFLADKVLKVLTVRLQYQRVDKNYEPLNIHKGETYPPNYQGIMADVKYPFPQKLGYLSLTYYDLSQVDPDANSTKNITTDAQNDYTFTGTGGAGSALVNTAVGRIRILSPEFVYNVPGDKWKIGGYHEEISFNRPADAAGATYYKRQGNTSLWVHYKFDKKFTGILGYRNLNFTGNWNGNPINHRMTIPKIGFMYEIDKDISATILYNRYSFADSAIAGSGLNNWQDSQLLTEFRIKF